MYSCYCDVNQYPRFDYPGSVWFYNDTPTDKTVSLWVNRLGGPSGQFPWVYQTPIGAGKKEEIKLPLFAKDQPIFMNFTLYDYTQNKMCLKDPVFMNTESRPYYLREVIAQSECSPIPRYRR